MRALVIDDSKAVRGLLKRELSHLGFDVFEAGNGKEGIDRLEELGPVDVALVDWTMPVMDGLSFLKEVRSNPERFIVGPDDSHVDPNVEDVVKRTPEYWVVEKKGVAGDIAEDLDPRE